MISGHKAILPQFETYPAKIISLKLTDLLDSLQKTFEDFFSQQKEKPFKQNHAVLLFDHIWAKLVTPIAFSNEAELILFYKNLLRNLSHDIDDFCIGAQLSLTTFPQSIKNLLLQIACFYSVIAKYQFRLQQFSAEDLPHIFAKNVEALIYESSNIQTNLSHVNVEFSLTAIASFELTLQEIITTLTKSGYKLNVELASTVTKGLRQQPSENVLKQLDRLLSIDQLNVVIDHLKNAEQKGDLKAKKQYQQQLNSIIIILEDFKENLTKDLDEEIQYVKSVTEPVSRQTKSMIANLELLNSKLQNLSSLNKINSLIGDNKDHNKKNHLCLDIILAADNLVKAYQAVNHSIWRTNSLNLLKDKVQDIVREMNGFAKGFLIHSEKILKVQKTIMSYKVQLKQFTEVLSKLDYFFEKAKQLTEAFQTSINQVQTTLAQHAESDVEDIKSFLKNNWVKMFLGAISGMGVSSTIAGLTLAFNPATFGLILGMGGICGTSFGWIISLLTSQKSPELKQKPKESSEKTHPNFYQNLQKTVGTLFHRTTPPPKDTEMTSHISPTYIK